MELTKELLNKRLKVLEAQKAQVVANANACEGAIQTVRGLLSDLDREDETDEGAAQAAPSEEEDASD